MTIANTRRCLIIVAVSVLESLSLHSKHAAAFVYPQRKRCTTTALFNWKNLGQLTRSNDSVSDYSLPVDVMIPVQSDSTFEPYVYLPKNGVVTSFEWLPNEEYIHPELQDYFPVGQWLRQKANVGIALSGGGMRAASCTLGWLRALHDVGLLSEARYISSNSGATWVTVPLAAKELIHRMEDKGPFDYSYFLGNYIPPEDIRGERKELGYIGDILAKSDILANDRDFSKYKLRETALEKRQEMNEADDNPKQVRRLPIIGIITDILNRVQKAFLTNVVKPINNFNFTNPDANFTAWVKAIDENFVKGMDIPSSSRDFYTKLQHVYLWSKNNNSHVQASEFPFPIYVATVYPEGDKPGIAVPFEFTPFYAGIPMDPRIFNHPNFETGGGHSEYHVFNSYVKEPNVPPPLPLATVQEFPNRLYRVQLPAPENILNIAEVTGISSSFFGAAVLELGLRQQFLDRITRLLPGIPAHVKRFDNPTTYQYWSPASGGPSKALSFVDGGLYDNTGVLALLRRNCDCVIACVAADAAIYDKDPDKNGYRFSDLAALFGRQQSSGTDVFLEKVSSFLLGGQTLRRRLWNSFVKLIGFSPKSASPVPSPNEFKVFHGDDWNDLVGNLSAKWHDGVPQVVKMKLNVTENPKAGVYGNRTVDFIVCLNGRVRESWQNKLPDGLKREISPGWFGKETLGPEGFFRWVYDLKKPTKLSDYFPYFSTFRVIYDNSTVNLMAHLSSFSLKTGLEDVGFNIKDFVQ